MEIENWSGLTVWRLGAPCCVLAGSSCGAVSLLPALLGWPLICCTHLPSPLVLQSMVFFPHEKPWQKPLFIGKPAATKAKNSFISSALACPWPCPCVVPESQQAGKVQPVLCPASSRSFSEQPTGDPWIQELAWPMWSQLLFV